MKDLELSQFFYGEVERILASGHTAGQKVELLELLKNLHGFDSCSLAEILVSFFTYC